ncbi:MAG: response regulator [Kiritimatiellia bacterium]|jgi:CheY-like chemotaxis protein|nr:response regulator [Kiritimatiellia bacterium]MDP6847874.1 response regulator [Kiritimatiellia bacterium]
MSDNDKTDNGDKEIVRKKHILLVDDEEHLLVTLRDFLTHEGYEVTLARTAEKALAKLEKMEPDVVVLDISMPGIGGMGFLRRRGEADGPSIPVLVLTARANMKQFFDEVEVNGFLSKPCAKEDLLSEINRVIEETADRRVEPAKKENTSPVILLGEDDDKLADVLRRNFERHGYGVTVVPSGPEVLEIAPKGQVDLVVIKEIFTGMNGDKVVSLLKAMPSTKAVPIVLYGARIKNLTNGSANYDENGHVTGPDKSIRETDSVSLLSAIKKLLEPEPTAV